MKNTRTLSLLLLGILTTPNSTRNSLNTDSISRFPPETKTHWTTVTVLKDAYRAVSRAALGLSDHCLLHLIPTYRQKLKTSKPVAKTLKKWTRESKLELQACFDCTNWSVFEAAATDLNDLTDTVTSYIRFCEDLCVQAKTFCTYNNSKHWFTPNLRKLRQAKEEAHSSGDRDLYKQARNKLTKEIKVAERSYFPPTLQKIPVWQTT